MPVRKRILHIAASAARTMHLWPLIARTGAFNRARRRKYPDTIVHLDVVITERCTLRCRDCSNLMQHYRKPEDPGVDEVIYSLKRLLSSMRIEQLKILGGEPLICQGALTKLLEFLGKDAGGRIGHIDIITNGTLLPSEECLKAMRSNPKVRIFFSNYGSLSSKQEEFAGICSREGIRYEIADEEFWWDFGDLKERNENARRTGHRFAGCYSRRLCTTLYRGRLYVCPRQAHMTRLGIIPEDISGTVDISRPEYDDPAILRGAVYELIDRKEYISACRYCGCDSNTRIPRAIQEERSTDVTCRS